jgi:amino acid adenylation domain-containing protein
MKVCEVKSIREAVDVMAQAHPETAFLIDPLTGATVCFQELKQQSLLLAAMLHHAGLKKGDKVAFLMDNGLLTAQLFIGVMYGGYVAVPLNVRAGAVQLSYMLDHCDAKVVFVEDQYSVLLRDAAGDVRHDIRVITANVDGPLPAFESAADSPIIAPLTGEDEALLMYSSGSTGKSKGAIHTHSSILAHGRNSIEAHQLSSADRSLLVLPLYHINAECVTLIPTLLSGGSVVVAHRFDVSRFWDWVDDLHITWSALVPTIISELVDWDDPGKDRRQAAFQRIRFFRSSSAPLSPSLHQQFLDKFDLPLLQAMGSTEGGNVFSNPVPPGKNKIGSPGLPWGFEARIVDREGANVPPGESGEVLLRGAGMMREYYKDSEGTAAVLDNDGWLHTGDLARQDEDGYFFVVGRSKELIIKGGVNIAPRQIDEVLESHPAVLEAAAVGVPDRYFGEDAVAFVVPRSDSAVDEKELLAYCETRLGHFKTPSRIYFLKELPKGPSGKVQRLRLLDPDLLSSVAALTQTGNGMLAGTEQKADLPTTHASIEQIVSAAWSAVLGIPHVDPDANFFALGGHSLLAIQCLSLLREKLPIVLSLADFFENGTVAEQAGLIRQRLHPASDAADVSSNWEQSLLQHYVPPAEEQIPRRLDPSLPNPLSPAERRLWFMDQLNHDVPVYNLAEAVQLAGEFDLDTFRRSLNEIVMRHEVLRSTIEVVEDVPYWKVHESWPIHLNQIDLCSLTPVERQAEVDRLLIDEPRAPYDLEAEPGIRFALIHLGARDYVFILMVHHIIGDWSTVGVFWRELSALYHPKLAGEMPLLPPLPITHGDYTAWQEQKLLTACFDEDMAYWENALRGAPALLELPADRPRPERMSHSGGRLRWKLNRTLTEALRGLSRQEKTSLFTIFAATLNTLLYRYTGKEDILLGIPFADRDQPELQSMIGFLLHTHVLRTNLSRGMTFRELLGHVQKGTLDLYAHRSVPFDMIVRKLHPERNLSYSPLFQVMLNWRDRDQLLPFIGLDGLTIDSLMASAGTSQFDLLLFATDSGDEIWLELEYNTDIFNEDRMQRLLGHYQTLLESVVGNPSTAIDHLPLLTASERDQLIYAWNHTNADFPADLCVHQLFEEQVDKTPAATAISFAGTELSYHELNRRANQLAHYLQGLGVVPDMRVAICIERSLEMVIAVLGVLKAGGAYVPLDPAYPPDRLRYMLEDSQPIALITQSRLQTKFANFDAALTVCNIDASEFAWSNCPDSNPEPRSVGLNSNHPAYVIYTSGSTGQPKGVMGLHRATVNRFCWMYANHPFEAGEVCCARASLSFVDSVWELLGPLCKGIPVVLISATQSYNLAEFAEILASKQISRLLVVPTLLRAMLEAQRSEEIVLPQLKYWITSGEALSGSLAREFYEMFPESRLLNLYGSSEDAGDVSCYEVENGIHHAPVPIGRPIANAKMYLLDSSGEPVPIGIAGELFVGGVPVARGYFNRPELNAERFLVDPFSAESGARMFRTGDLGRWLSDGNMEYLGRIDNQVKIRGIRIELGEIEAELLKHEKVSKAAVIARDDSSGDRRLTAYVVAHEDERQSQEESLSNIADWQQLWTETYLQGDSFEADFNIVSWVSSYTGEQLPAEEMRIWVDKTVSNIRKFGASRVVEVGCGTGLLLTRLAANCDRYVGLDFSAEVLDRLKSYSSQREDLNHVELRQGLAHDLSFLADNSVDLVILNSVVQYFPSVDYLLDVLTEAARVTRDGGHIFVGDVRNMLLMNAYHASVQLTGKSQRAATAAELQRKIQEAQQKEEELVLDPRLFEELGKRWKKIGHAEVSLKPGNYDNELTRFRFDAVLTVGRKQAPEEPEMWLHWDAAGRWRKKVEQLLWDRPEISVGVREIPDSRVQRWVNAANTLTLGEDIPGEDPDEIMQFAATAGAGLRWHGFSRDGVYDCVFNPRWKPISMLHETPRSHYRKYANTPAGGTRNYSLERVLREYLSSRLPDYMVPAAFVSLRSLPLTASGKLDRKTLESLDVAPLSQPVVDAPRDSIEAKLARIWEHLLEVAPIDIRSNFFDSGGHSLLVVKMFAMINKEFQQKLPMTAIFASPTIEQLATIIRGHSVDGKEVPNSTIDQAARTDSSIIPIKPFGTAAPLFIIHGVQGHVVGFYQLAMLIGTDHPVYGIQAQSILAGQPALLRLEDQAAYYLSEIRKIQPKGPYYLLGYCFGGTVAFEIAHQLNMLGEHVELLGLLDTAQRDCVVRTERNDQVGNRVRRRIRLILDNFASLPFREKAIYLPKRLLTRTLRYIYGTAPSVGIRTVPSFMKNGEEICRMAVVNYRSRPWPGPVTLFRASVQQNTQLPEDLGWSSFAQGGVEVCEVPGNHYEIFVDPNVRVLAERIRERLVQLDVTETPLHEHEYSVN